MNKFTLGLLSAAAITTTLLLMRQQEQEKRGPKDPRLVPAGESQPRNLSLERIRELGL